ALAPFCPVPCGRIMFNYTTKVRIGSWWLSVGVRFGFRPFVFYVFPGGIREVCIRFLWLECSISELPF
ncbi:MAG TPA: hypothetical protein PLS08_02990, partial [Chryseolinea sp.]|nr:hypothetical protein [Chryseolinea sp.]